MGCWEPFSVVLQRVAVKWPGRLPVTCDAEAQPGAGTEQKGTEWQASGQASLSQDTPSPCSPPAQGFEGSP